MISTLESGGRDMIREKTRAYPMGYGPLLLGIALFALGIYMATHYRGGWLGVGLPILLFLSGLFTFAGLFVVNPNESKVLQLFGAYVGTARESGLRWANPFYSKKRVSVRVRNFETGKLKVNDASGNPVEIASVVVWRVVDTAEATFNVDDYRDFVHVQSEAALRNLATRYPYVTYDAEEKSLSVHIA